MIKKYIKENRDKLIEGFILPEITCQDGFRISVQCGFGHYSSPEVKRSTDGLPRDPTHFELGFPSKYESMLTPYTNCGPYHKKNFRKHVFGWVPIFVVEEILKKHSGIKEGA